MITKADEVPV